MGITWIPGRPTALSVIANGALLAFACVRAVVNARAAARLRARHHMAMLRRLAELTAAVPTDLAPILGVTAAEIDRWECSGIPSARQDDVARLLRTAAALRRELPASVARALLALQARRVAELEHSWQLISDLAGRARAGGVVMTMRH